MGMKLFDGTDSSDDETKNISNIEINQEFARRYQHNKQREDLHRLQDLKKKGLVNDSSDTGESSEDEPPSFDKDIKFLQALIKVKNQGPLLKTEQDDLFDSESDEDDEKNDDPDEKKRGKRKPMYLKDVAAKHLLEEGPEFEEREDDVKTYVEELEETKREFLDAVGAQEDDGGELLKMKEDRVNGDEDDEDGGEYDKKLDEYFGEDDKLDEDNKFLKEFFRKNMLLEENGHRNVDDFGVSEDEEEIERQEEYEREFNFRFEENAGDRILGHSRVVEGSVRKKPNARKLQRQRKEERMAQAKVERDEEVKHLKNLQKKLKNEKLRKIWAVAGIGEERGCALNEDYIEKEFNPDEHDRKMGEMFDDDYYEADDADPEFGSDEDEEDGGELQKPDFGKEDELLGLPKGWDDVYGSGGDGFLAVRERKLKQKLDKVEEEDEEDEEDEEEDEDEEDEDEGEMKKKRKRSSLEEEVIKKEMEEYYKLDYEDTIGDLKTRFKYRPVNAKRYGLSTEEVLVMDDKELNQYVSLKKLAPYREKEWKVPRIKTYGQKLKNKSLLEGETSVGHKSSKKLRKEIKRPSKTVGEYKSEKPQMEESNGDMDNQSRRSKRRHRQAELKLSHSRLLAYGKINSKSKSKKKHET